MNANDLLEGFDPVSPKAWKQKIQVDLKGGDYNELLTHLSPEGILIKPFYTAEDAGDRSSVSVGREGTWQIGVALDAHQEGAILHTAHGLPGSA